MKQIFTALAVLGVVGASATGAAAQTKGTTLTTAPKTIATTPTQKTVTPSPTTLEQKLALQSKESLMTGAVLYKGSTLHNAAGTAWTGAGEAARLASASEFVGYYFSDQIETEQQLHAYTAKMSYCIGDVAARSTDAGATVFDFAETCAQAMGWQASNTERLVVQRDN